MTKQEFISRLRAALSGKLSPGLVEDHINYYEDYINTEIRKGRTEEEVLASLGDPRLIARTIVETNGRGQNAGGQSMDTEGFFREYREPYTEEERREKRVFRFPVWAWILLVILVLAVAAGLAFSLLAFLAPVILPILLVVFLVKLFRDWLN
ncbi:MAG TPA: DUF1700 domain-containing protein [Candidatus Acetatifactor stercoripullorum]|uniref:DUF1700 domain-containing protein n=1 Tax=Candidatus Acetatifactor stercoripullorum TaxID=2838414 RepID=A0A9D1R5G3_9FIRM|nr:DUF1700 domain-containing protein [uncultured Acetatifactor sp.]HIW81392.1 DUF1700 domain-containing protein [Candidatus Acetatifactor stercoripullorum]